MHFCAGLPIILVGCKKDLRRDPRVIEELRKTNQRPVTPEEVGSHFNRCGSLSDNNVLVIFREWPLHRRLEPSTILNVLLRRVKEFAKSSSMPHAQPSLRIRGRRIGTNASYCKYIFK
jgi:GTPase SAR1 family protein